MKIKSITCKNFKRFTDLTIRDIPEDVKLVILLGPNGCGKSSLFEAFNAWHKLNGYGNFSRGEYYIKNKDIKQENDNVEIEFHQEPKSSDDMRSCFYIRTAYRNEPEIRINDLSKVPSPLDKPKVTKLNQNDTIVSSDYQRLVSSTVKGVFDGTKDNIKVSELRKYIVGKIHDSLLSIFPDLVLSNIGNPLENGSFYFDKGDVKNFDYMNLSAGEKSAFDLILDIIIKQEYYPEAIYCVDEPELHMHTALQAKLLREMYHLIPDNSQLWISTHSVGMLKEANNIREENNGTVAYIDFSDHDFDEQVEIKPSLDLSHAIWQRFIESTLGEFSTLIAPSKIVFCEGDPKGKEKKNFDAEVYNKIFNEEFPDTLFVSIGSCNDLINSNNLIINVFRQYFKSKFIILIDRDDCSEEEIDDSKKKGVTVLSRRHIESYLYDEEIIKKLCMAHGKENKIDECINMMKEKMKDSVVRGNASDDIKSASGNIYIELKRKLDLTGCGNSATSFARDTLAPLITKDTEVYQALKNDIFGCS